MSCNAAVTGDISGPTGIEFRFEVCQSERLERERGRVDRMFGREPARNRRGGIPKGVGRLIAALFAMALLAACQNGGLTYDPSTGLFSMPFGAQSHKDGG